MMDGYIDQVRLLKPGLSEAEVRATVFFLFNTWKRHHLINIRMQRRVDLI